MDLPGDPRPLGEHGLLSSAFLTALRCRIEWTARKTKQTLKPRLSSWSQRRSATPTISRPARARSPTGSARTSGYLKAATPTAMSRAVMAGLPSGETAKSPIEAATAAPSLTGIPRIVTGGRTSCARRRGRAPEHRR
ncbi:hypothetical protein ACFQX6_20740 [Streptosporangium lutulentum]